MIQMLNTIRIIGKLYMLERRRAMIQMKNTITILGKLYTLSDESDISALYTDLSTSRHRLLILISPESGLYSAKLYGQSYSFDTINHPTIEEALAALVLKIEATLEHFNA